MHLDPKEVNLTKNSHPSFIGSWILNDLSICDRLIEYIDDTDAIENGETYPGTIVYNGQSSVKKETKDSLDRILDYQHQVCRDYSNMLQTCLNMYTSDFSCANNVSQYSDVNDRGNVQKYPKGGAYHGWHAERDGMSSAHRHLVFMTFLNDITDAGETEFKYQKLKVKPQKGLTLIWPSDWTHTHRGIPSVTQEKYIVTGWYSFVN